MTPSGAWGGSSERGFRRSERFRTRSEFQRVYENGKSYPGPLLVLFVLTSPDLERKVGIVAGRRVGNAVARNRAKRLLREAYRLHKVRIPPQEVHLVLIARKGCGEASYAGVEKCFLELLDSAGIGAGRNDEA